MAKNKSATAEKQTYQAMLAELDELLAWFQSEDVDLDEAIGKYEQGLALIARLEDHIRGTSNSIEKIKQRFDLADRKGSAA